MRCCLVLEEERLLKGHALLQVAVSAAEGTVCGGSVPRTLFPDMLGEDAADLCSQSAPGSAFCSLGGHLPPWQS